MAGQELKDIWQEAKSRDPGQTPPPGMPLPGLRDQVKARQDLTSNEAGEGLYRMGSYDYSGGRVSLPEIPVPFSKIQQAIAAGYKLHPDEAKRYSHDVRYQGHGSNWWSDLSEKVQKALQPVPDATETIRGKNVQMPPVGLDNTDRAFFRTILGAGPYMRNTFQKWLESTQTHNANEFLDKIDPSMMAKGLYDQFRADWAKDHKLAIDNLKGDLLGTAAVGLATHAAGEAIPRVREAFGGPRIKTEGEVEPPAPATPPAQLARGGPPTIEGSQPAPRPALGTGQRALPGGGDAAAIPAKPGPPALPEPGEVETVPREVVYARGQEPVPVVPRQAAQALPLEAAAPAVPEPVPEPLEAGTRRGEGALEARGVRRLEEADPGVVSTRIPTGRASEENPHEDLLTTDLDTLRDAPAANSKALTPWEKAADLFKSYTNFNRLEGTPNRVIARALDQMTKNLLWLHDQMPAALRDRAKLWYEGANRIANTWATSYNKTPDQAAGIMAVLSPQRDWFQNVSLAQRVMDIMTHQQGTPWDDAMSAFADNNPALSAYPQLIANVRGKTLGELSDVGDRALWLRVYDEAHNPRHFRTVTPEGGFADYALNQPDRKGVQGKTAIAWGGLDTIGKAISIFEDGSRENISSQLGGAHKVRNFYNNIIAPDSETPFVTIDTHAVAAALLEPLAGGDTEVQHNLGQGMSSAHAGIQGTYPVYSEAYRRAAEARGIKPREMQSITWEAVRGLFTPEFKQNQGNKEVIKTIWNGYNEGRLSLKEAQKRIHDTANGIRPPAWSNRAADAPSWDSSYAGELDQPRVPGESSEGVDAGAGAGTAPAAAAAEPGGRGGVHDDDRGGAGADVRPDAVRTAAARPPERADAHPEGAEPEGAPWAYTRRVRRDGEGARVLGAPVHETWALNPAKKAELEADGFQSPDIHELAPADPKSVAAFHSAISQTKVGNKYAASVHVYEPAEYAETRMFLAEDGKAGFALKPDGDIISVFTHGDGPKGASHTMLEIAKQAGGTKMDCFDTVLPKIYGAHGFRAASRMKWNDEYSPEGWDKKIFSKYNSGEPDVVFMALDPASKPYQPGDGEMTDDYDKAVEIQTNAIKEGAPAPTAAPPRPAEEQPPPVQPAATRAASPESGPEPTKVEREAAAAKPTGAEPASIDWSNPPAAGKRVAGLAVSDKIPNRSSIQSSLDNPVVLKGVRELPLDAEWNAAPEKTFRSASDIKRVYQLAEEIKKSGRIDPLIVTIENGEPSILEGTHRLSALHLLGKKSFPALVVMEGEEAPRPLKAVRTEAERRRPK